MQHALMNHGVRDDPFAFIDFRFSSFELGFDQRQNFTGRPDQSNCRRKNLPQRNERAVNHDEIGRLKWLRKTGERDLSGIGFFHYHDARIIAQLPGKLSLADIDGVNFRRAMLQQAIGESAGGRASVETPARRLTPAQLSW